MENDRIERKGIKYYIISIISFLISNAILYLLSHLIFGANAVNNFVKSDEIYNEIIYIFLVIGISAAIMKLFSKIKILSDK